MLFQNASVMLSVSILLLLSSVSALPLSTANVPQARDDHDSVLVGQQLWGFIWPVAPQFISNPIDQLSFDVGKEVDVTFITPFETTRLEIQTTDGNYTQIISDNDQGPTIKWTVSRAGLPGSYQNFQLRLTSPSSTDPHAGLALLSAPFAVMAHEPSIFGPIARWSLGMLMAVLFGFVMVVIGLAAAVSAIVHRFKHGPDPDQGGSIAAYMSLNSDDNVRSSSYARGSRVRTGSAKPLLMQPAAHYENVRLKGPPASRLE